MGVGADIKAGLSGLARLWNAGRVNALGSGLSLTGGTLAATGGITAGENITVTSGTVAVAHSPAFVGVTQSAPIVLTANAGTPQAAPAGTVAQVVGVDAGAVRELVDAYGGTPNLTTRRAGGTAATPSAVLSQDVLFSLNAFGRGTTVYSAAFRAGIEGRAFQNWSDTQQGSYLSFLVTGNNTTTTAEVMRINQTGGVLINQTTDDGTTKLQVTGNIKSTATITAGIADLSLRSVPFSISGKPGNAQKMIVTMTQAGILQANGGAASGTIGTNPTATNTLVLSTINNTGTVTNQGTISIASTGVITFPTFTAVAMPAGGALQLVNQAAADATLADFCLSVQVRVN